MPDQPNSTESSAPAAANAASPQSSATGAEAHSFGERLRHWLTAQPVIWLFIATFACVIFLNPAKVGLLLWGVSKLAAFGFAGDWIDARIFRGAQPDKLTGIEQGTAWKRKGLIVAASIVAGAMLP
jgi:hypothetical protein